MTDLIVASKVRHDPFKSLFLQALVDRTIESIPDRTSFIQEFLRQIDELENNSENEATFLHWSSIFTGFSGAGVLSSFAVLNPVIAGIAGLVAAGSAIGVISLAYAQNQERQPILEKLRRYKIALDSDQAINWACLWEYTGTNLFLSSLYQAQTGHLSDNRVLLRTDGKNPMAAALDSCCQNYGLKRDDLIEIIRQLKSGVAVKLPQATLEARVLESKAIAPAREQAKIPDATVLQDDSSLPATKPTTNFFLNGLDILDGLVADADKRVRGGCVILAAPGAGKTTFLGCAWGRLRETYGERFKSLAVLVKPGDVEAFKACSDNAICVKTSPVKAAIAIIKFIEDSLESKNSISRLFLDDFLTMNRYFESALTGIFFNPYTYQVYGDAKEKREAGDIEARLLTKVLGTSLNELWLVGRERNAALYVSSHSPNVDTLPFVGSKDSRNVNDLIFLAKNDKREFLDQTLNNPNLIADNNKRQILKDALNSGEAKRDQPWILANFQNWTLGQVPSSVHEEYQAYREEWEEGIKTKVMKDKLEDVFKLEVEDIKTSNSSSLIDDNEETTYSYMAQVVLDIIKSGNPPVSFESIRKSRKWAGAKPKAEEIRLAISELIFKEIVEGNDDSGYSLS